MDIQKLWMVAEEAWSALAEQFEPVAEQMCAQHDMEGRTFGLLLSVLTFEPEDTTPGHLMVRGPYTSADEFLNRLQGAADQGFLIEIAQGRYRLSDEGRKCTHNIADEIRRVMAKVDPLPLEDSGRLAELLDRLVQSSMNTPPPPNPWSINLSYKLIPHLNPPMPFIEQAFSCLSAYRDDSHLAAWRRSGLSAIALESLTLLWRGETTSLAGLYNKLFQRGHSLGIYQGALQELGNRGLVAGSDQAIRVTRAGKGFRNKIEADTDKYFYLPWSCLKESEMSEMLALLTRMRDGLK